MSAFDRISSIENRIQQMEARLEAGGPAAQRSAPGKPGIAVGRGSNESPVSFESLLNTMSDDKKFRPGAGVGGYAPMAPTGGTWKGGNDPKQFDGMIRDASKKHGVEESLIRAVIRQESAYNPNATSHCGAMGLMQLMPETAKDLGCGNAYDPAQNIMAGAKYLRQMQDRFPGNLTKAIAAYNAGPGNVEHYGGIPPFAETQNYVGKVLDNYRNYKGMGG